MLIEYSSNNSGGGWWLKDKDWTALEKAGWRVMYADQEFVFVNNEHVYDDGGYPKTVTVAKPSLAKKDKDGRWRWLGALAKRAYKHFDEPSEAMREFERVTGQQVSEEGCNCCGPPHSFSWRDNGKYEYVSGERCLAHLYENPPENLRKAAEMLSEKRKNKKS